jgi:hypothetical protein
LENTTVNGIVAISEEEASYADNNGKKYVILVETICNVDSPTVTFCGKVTKESH